MNVYFYKEIRSNSIVIGTTKADWEELADNKGVIVLDDVKDAELVKGLREVANAFPRRGVLEITEAQYTEKKSLYPFNQSAISSRNREFLRVAPRLQMPKPKAKPSPPPPPVAVPPVAPVVNTPTGPRSGLANLKQAQVDEVLGHPIAAVAPPTMKRIVLPTPAPAAGIAALPTPIVTPAP